MKTLTEYIQENRDFTDAEMDRLLREADALSRNIAFQAVLSVMESETVALLTRAPLDQGDKITEYKIMLRVIQRVRNDLADFIKKANMGVES